jgi:hypothetical protein
MNAQNLVISAAMAAVVIGAIGLAQAQTNNNGMGPAPTDASTSNAGPAAGTSPDTAPTPARSVDAPSSSTEPAPRADRN